MNKDLILACNDAPTFVDAYRLAGSVSDKGNLVWLHYWQFYAFNANDATFGSATHYGDWEHVCILTSLNDLGVKTANPLSIHFHRHGGVDIRSTAYSYHQNHECVSQGTSSPNCFGKRHPRVFVQAWGHGAYRDPGNASQGPHFGGFLFSDEPFNNPIVFLKPHYANTGLEDDVVQAFRGRWGQSGGATPSPKGPDWNTSNCDDHDYDPSKNTTPAYWTPCDEILRQQ